MITVTLIENDGKTHQIMTPAGVSLMQAAVDNSVPGILADCGGGCACATCHCYVDVEWRDKLPVPDSHEKALLECALEPNENSRLSCQIQLSPELDGLVVHLPIAQL